MKDIANLRIAPNRAIISNVAIVCVISDNLSFTSMLCDLGFPKDTRLPDTSRAEQVLCESLTPILHAHTVGDAIGTLPEGSYLLSLFQFFLPEVLREVHDDWRYESLDGVYPKVFDKTGEREIEVIGIANFITDQTLTPLHFRLQLSANFDRVSWIDLRMGEHTGQGCRREPYGSATVHGTMLHVVERLDTIEWYYHVGYGKRET